MRPVDKGEELKEKYSKYQEAEKILEKRIGAYCSFCEFPIMHVPADSVRPYPSSQRKGS